MKTGNYIAKPQLWVVEFAFEGKNDWMTSTYVALTRERARTKARQLRLEDSDMIVRVRRYTP